MENTLNSLVIRAQVICEQFPNNIHYKNFRKLINTLKKMKTGDKIIVDEKLETDYIKYIVKNRYPSKFIQDVMDHNRERKEFIITETLKLRNEFLLNFYKIKDEKGLITDLVKQDIIKVLDSL